MKKVTICVCTYGDNFFILNRCISSIFAKFDRNLYDIRVGCNSCCSETINYLKNVNIDKLLISENNLYKNGMMKYLFEDINTDYIFWFDDDSHVLINCLENILKVADNSQKNEAIFGTLASFPSLIEIEMEMGLDNWIKKQLWYKNRPYPSTQFEYCKSMDGFYFVIGGNYLIKTNVVKEISWPSDPTGLLFNKSPKRQNPAAGEDIILGEALHQNLYKCVNLGPNYGIAVNDYKSRSR